MAQRRDFPVTDEQLSTCGRCGRCKKQVVWTRPTGYSTVIPLDVASRERDGVSGMWRLEAHVAYCAAQPRKPRKKFGGHRSVGSEERSFD